MKWIGQHIYDLISRFRNDVYLENISSGTIASGGNLGLDANNKIVKANEATGDITSISLAAGSGIDLTGVLNASGGDYEARIDVDVSDFMSSGAQFNVLTATGADAMQAEPYLQFRNLSNISNLKLLSNENTSDFAEFKTTTNGSTTIRTVDADAAIAHFELDVDGNITLDAAGDIALEAGGDDLTLDADTFTFTSATTQKPNVFIEDTSNDADGSRFIFNKNRGAAGQDADLITALQFKSYNDAGTPEHINYAQIVPKIHDASDGVESGQLLFQVQAHGGGNVTGLMLTGGSQDDEVDVTVGLGTSSLTTVAGNLEVTTGVELGHASDTTLSRSAAGTLAVEGKNVRTEDKTIMIKPGSFASGSGGFTAGDVVFFPMTGTAENTSANGTAQPFLAPANGKLLKLHFRSNKDHHVNTDGSDGTHIFTLRNWDDDEQFTDGNKTILAQKTVTGVQKNQVLTIDFRSSLDTTANADTNEFTVGETLCIGMENSFDTNTTTKYYFTAVFEFDFSSY